jgi:PDDEXK-like domain of unknown function (DUF3799)
MPLITEPGVYPDIPAEEYHADPAPLPSLSATLGKIILAKSPLHAWHASRRLNPNHESTDRKTFDIGRAAHRAILGAGDDYVQIPDEVLASNGAASTKEAKAFIAAQREAGHVPLKSDEIEKIEAMQLTAQLRLSERGICFNPDRSELCGITQIDGVWCRAMFDNVPVDPKLPIYDFKTCEDASPEACLRSIINYGYDLQAAHYAAVWKAITGEERGFVFVFQEKSQPHEIALIQLTGMFQDVAERRAARARRIWGECVTTNKWPGYPAGLHQVDPPAWLVESAYQEEM